MVRFAFAATLLAALVAPSALSQDEGPKEIQAKTFRIDRFSHQDAMESFSFSGMVSGLPDGTRLAVQITLDGELGALTPVFVAGGRFEGEISTAGKEVLPGTYLVTVAFRRTDQPAEVQASLRGNDLEEDVATKACPIRAAQAAREKARIQQEIFRIVREIRDQYDKAAQLGVKVMKAVEAAPSDLKSADRMRLLEPWAKYYRESEGPLATGLENFLAKHAGAIFVSPWKSVEQAVHTLFEAVLALRSAYTVDIMTKLGMEDQVLAIDRERARFKPPALINQINAVAWSIQSRLGTEDLPWSPRVSIAKEKGSFSESTYVSSTSGFSIARPSEKWEVVQGQADSTLRVAFNYSLGEMPFATAQVHMVEFPWAETRDELVQAWVRLAEYEWPHYTYISGGYEHDEEGNVVHYAFHFRTRSEEIQNALVDCYLYFPAKKPHIVYGIIVVTLWEGIIRHHQEEDFKKLVGSFRLIED